MNPITTLQKKSVWFIWSQQRQDSFDKLKHLLTSTPILRIVDPNKDFVVWTNATKEVLWGILTQEGHVICYESIKLKENEKNYVVHYMELEVIIHALKIWWHYLLGKKIMLPINNMGLQ